jgi:hypothetical protein
VNRLAGLGLAGLVSLVGACSKGTEGGVRLKQATSALQSAGFKTDALQKADPAKLSAQSCMQGALEGVDVMLCEYGSADAVALGKKGGEDWVGTATTGAVLMNGNAMLAVADRNRADPNGKTIHKLTQAFNQAK